MLNHLTDIPVAVLFRLIKNSSVLIYCVAELANEAVAYHRLMFKRAYWIECNRNLFETIRAKLRKLNSKDLICAALGDLLTILWISFCQ